MARRAATRAKLTAAAEAGRSVNHKKMLSVNELRSASSAFFFPNARALLRSPADFTAPDYNRKAEVNRGEAVCFHSNVRSSSRIRRCNQAIDAPAGFLNNKAGDKIPEDIR